VCAVVSLRNSSLAHSLTWEWVSKYDGNRGILLWWVFEWVVRQLFSLLPISSFRARWLIAGDEVKPRRAAAADNDDDDMNALITHLTGRPTGLFYLEISAQHFRIDIQLRHLITIPWRLDIVNLRMSSTTIFTVNFHAKLCTFTLPCYGTSYRINNFQVEKDVAEWKLQLHNRAYSNYTLVPS